jgi:hypothetical protein
MIYKHGSYSVNCHLIRVTNEPVYNALGQLIQSTKSITIEGVVYGTTKAEIKTAIEAFESAFGAQVTKSGFYHDDAATEESAHVIDTAGDTTESGIQTAWAWIDRTAEYINRRSFQATISCVFLGAGALEYVYSNEITLIGTGGPVRVPRYTQGGVVVQIAYPSSVYRAIEFGRKESRSAVVNPKLPTFPYAIRDHQSMQTSGGTMRTGGVTRYVASWNYPYFSNTPI